jgi:hypothetical protein
VVRLRSWAAAFGPGRPGFTEVARAAPHMRAGIQARGRMPQRSLGGRGLQFELHRLEGFERQINYMSKEA